MKSINSFTWLKSALVAAFITPPLLNCPSFLPLASAQDALVMNGTQILDLAAASGTIPVDGLQPLGLPWTYDGAPAQYSQNAQFDHDGNLLFFVVDGRVYDHEGYLIADNALDPNCQECLFEGITEVLITLVPGSCSQYYMVAAKLEGTVHALGYSILDLSIPNSRHPGRYGHVIDLDDVLNDPGLTAQFGTAFFGQASFGTWGNNYFQGLSDCMIDLEDQNTPSSPYERGMHLALYDPDDCDTEKKILIAVDEAFLHYYEVRPDGIEKISAYGHQQLINGSGSVFGYETRRPYAGAAAFGKAQNGDVLFAFSWVTPDVGPTGPTTILTKVQFDGTVEWLADLETVPSSTQGSVDVSGLVFSPSADHLYLLQSKVPHAALVDLSTQTTTDLAPALGITDPQEFAYGTLALDKEVSGPDQAIYYRSPARMAALEDPDLGVLATWSEPVSTSIPLLNAPLATKDQINPVVLPDLHNYREQQIPRLSSEGCCRYRSELAAVGGFTSAGSATFYDNSNPWNDQQEVFFDQDVRVLAGHQIQVHDMTWRFAPGARLIIEPGGQVFLYNSTLSSYACAGLRWGGVEVQADPDPFTPWDVDRHGQLRLYQGSEISNAVIGVLCSEWVNGTFNSSANGGIVRAANSTFRNNLVDVSLMPFLPNWNLQSRCRFSNCDFLTDGDWPDPPAPFNDPPPGYSNCDYWPAWVEEVPQRHALLLDVNDVSFINCSFANDAPALFPVGARGCGVYAFNSGFDVVATPDPNAHYMRNLAFGVQAVTTNPAFTYRVRGMDFQNNWYGILDMGSSDPRIHLNTFHALNELWIWPSVELFLFQTEGYSVEQNIFNGAIGSPTPSFGVYFYGPTYQDNRIYDNTFNDLWVACQVEGEHVGTIMPGSNVPVGLQMLCGDHTNNGIDQATLLDGLIRENQGYSSDPTEYANNRYFSTPNCASTWEPWVDPGEDPCPGGDFCVQYFYYEHGSNPEMRPECVDGTHVEDVYDVIAPDPQGNPFDKEVHCADGDLDDSGGGILVRINDYRGAVDALVSAINAYHGTVDGGDKPDLLEAIHFADPWHPSHYLRDIMLAQHPLSDEVMEAALYREVPMDQWHLTQVLIDNSPLNRRFQHEVQESGKLNPFFLALLDQAQSGGTSTREVLEMEVSVRHEEKDRMRHRLLAEWTTDTIIDHPIDSLVAWLQADPSPNALRDLYRLYTKQGMQAEADALLPQLEADEPSLGIRQLGVAELAVQGDWLNAEGTYVNELWSLKDGPDQQGKGEAWALLHLLGETEEVPTAILPGGERSAAAWAPPVERTAYELTLQAYPNPAATTAWFTLPDGFPAGTLELLDAQGRLVRQLPVRDLIAEVAVRDLEPGMYLARLLFEGMQVAETKLTIVR